MRTWGTRSVRRGERLAVVQRAAAEDDAVAGVAGRSKPADQPLRFQSCTRSSERSSSPADGHLVERVEQERHAALGQQASRAGRSGKRAAQRSASQVARGEAGLARAPRRVGVQREEEGDRPAGPVVRRDAARLLGQRRPRWPRPAPAGAAASTCRQPGGPRTTMAGVGAAPRAASPRSVVALLLPPASGPARPPRPGR